MKKTFCIDGRMQEFTEVTLIADGKEWEGILLHQEDDINCDGDCVAYGYVTLPEDEYDAANLIESETWISDYEILDTAKIAERA